MLYFILIIILFSLAFFGTNVYSTHTSKPILSVNKTIYDVDGPISINGWVEYYDSPISGVLLDIIVTAKNGNIIMREGAKSDPSGNFTTTLIVPDNTLPGNYALRIISECRIEHIDICLNQETILPIVLTGNHPKNNDQPSNTISLSTYSKKHSNATIFSFDTQYYSKMNLQNVTCNGRAATSLGTPDNDLFLSTNVSDVVNTLEGNDTIYLVGTGSQRVCTSEGNDLVIDNSLGNDIIYGGFGNDIISSFSNHTIVDGEEGDDILVAMGNGKNILYGGNNDDLVIDNSLGNDIIYGGIGNDIINSNRGNNTIHGGYTNDTIFDETINSAINGNEGYDIIIAGEDTQGTINGGPGVDECKSSRIVYNCEI